MSKLAGKTMQWLLDAKDKYERGMPDVKDAKRKALMQVGLDAVNEEIERRRNLKNGEGQPVQPKPTPTPEKQNPKPAPKPETVQPIQNRQSEEKQVGPVLIADALTPVPAPTIAVKWVRGEVKEMTQGELRQKTKDYFRDIVKGETDTEDFEQLVQFHNCVRFLIGLYRFGNDLLPHLTLHPTFNACGEAMQERSTELYRQIAEKWKEFKDVL